MDLEQKASLTSGADFWHTQAVPGAGIPSLHGHRRTARPAQAGRRRRRASGSAAASRPPASRRPSGWPPPGTPTSPTRVGRRSATRPRRGRSPCCSARASTSSARRCADAISSTSPRTRCSPAARRRLVDGLQSHRRRHVAQALRRQQPGDRPDAGERRRRRADPARDLPAGVRAHRQDRAAGHGHVRLQQDQRRRTRASTTAAHRGAARRVGLRGPGGLRLGRGRATAWRALAAGLDLEMPPSAAPTPRSSPPSGPATLDEPTLDRADPASARSRRRHRRRSQADPADLRRRRPPRARPRGRRRSRPCCSRTTAPSCRSIHAGSDRGHRRVRAHAALPGRRQFAGRAHPSSTTPSTPSATDRRHRQRPASPPASPSTDTAAPARAGRRGGRGRCRDADVAVLFLGLARRGTSPRASTATDIDLPAAPAGRCSTPSAAPTRTSWSCCPTARSSTTRLGSTRPRASLEGWLLGQARRPRDRRSAVRRANPSGKLAETIPASPAGQSVVPALPRRRAATSATAKASTSATATTTPSVTRGIPVRVRAQSTPASTTAT